MQSLGIEIKFKWKSGTNKTCLTRNPGENSTVPAYLDIDVFPFGNLTCIGVIEVYELKYFMEEQI
jgi:hypothetical protein